MVNEFNTVFGRSYQPFLQGYRLDDAEMVFFGQGAHTMPAAPGCRQTAGPGREGRSSAVALMRPFPTDEVAECLSRFKVVGILENSNSFGSVYDAGPLTAEVHAALYYAETRRVF